MGVAEMVAKQALSGEDVATMGISNATLLLPLHRKGELTEEDIAIARAGESYSQIRQDLRKGEEPKERKGRQVICPNCSFEFGIDKQNE